MKSAKSLLSLLLMILVAASTLASCGGASNTTPTDSPTSATLAGTSWYLTDLNDKEVVPGSIVTADFGASDALSGWTGCNQYSASYLTEGERIDIRPAASTAFACEEALRVQEELFFEVAVQASTHTVEGDSLTLSNPDGSRVAALSALPSIPIAGTAWQMHSYSNGQNAILARLSDTDVSVEFGEDGSLTGSAGCNSYNTTYKTDGDSIMIAGPMAVTMMMCEQPGGIVEQESLYLAALESADTYRVTGAILALFDADGVFAVSYLPLAE